MARRTPLVSGVFKKAMKIMKRKENWQLFILPSDCLDCANAGPCLPESIGARQGDLRTHGVQEGAENY
jgi:hypothetical protein